MSYHVASYGGLLGEIKACALLVSHENKSCEVSSLSDSQESSGTGKHIVFALGYETGSIVIFGRNGVESRVEEPTSTTKFLSFSISGRYLISVTVQGSISTWDLTGGVPELVGHTPKCIWQQDDMKVSCTAMGDNFLYLGTNKGIVYVAPVDCTKPSGYFVSAERAAPELLDMDVTAGPVCCIAPEPKFGSTVLICYEQMVVLWDWGKTRRLNAWSVPKHESIGDVVDVAWNDCGSHFAIGLSSGVYSVVCVSMAESERINGRLVLHPRLIDVDNVPVDLSSISDSHTPVMAMEWLGTSLLIAGGRPLGSGGEELLGGITTIENAACNPGHRRQPTTGSRGLETCISFLPLWKPGDDVIWMKTTRMGYIWLLISSTVESSFIPWSSSDPPGFEYDRRSKLLVYEHSSLHSEAKSFDDELSLNHDDFVSLSHLFTFPEVTAACDLGLLSALDSKNMFFGLRTSVDCILHGGVVSWSKFIPRDSQDEALSLTQVVILGHADGTLSFWDVSGHDELSAKDIYSARALCQQQPRLGHQSQERFSFSPEVAHVRHILGGSAQPSPIAKKKNEKQHVSSSSSTIDDISIQIEKAKERASSILTNNLMADMFIGSSNSSNMTTSAMSPSETVFWSSISMSKDLPPQLFKECDLILRLHSNSITALDLCWDPRPTMSDSSIMVACDEVGVVSISHIATHEAIIPSCKVPVHHPRPCIKLGPCSSTVRKQQATDTGNDDDDDYSSCSLALYLLIDNLLSLYCPMTGKLLLSIDLKCVVSDPSHCPLGCLEPFWLIFTNAQGLALKSERGGKWIVSDGEEDVELDPSPHMLIAHAGVMTFVSCEFLLREGKKQRKGADMGGRPRSRQLSKGERIRGFNLIANNPGQISVPLEAEADTTTESGGSNGAVSSCVLLVDASGRTQCFSMPHLASLSTEEKGENELGVSRPLRTRPTYLCLESGSERFHLPPVLLVSSTGAIFVQVGPTQIDVFSVHRLNSPGSNHNHRSYRGEIRRCMSAQLYVKEARNMLVPDGDEPNSERGKSIGNSFHRTMSAMGVGLYKRGKSLKLDSDMPSGGLLLPKWEEVFVATSFDSVDSWPQICLKQELFDGADSRNLPDQDGNTQGGGGGTFDEVKGTMQGNVRMLHERGEKLDRMDNKVNALHNRAQNFEEMAKDLNESMDKKKKSQCKVS